MAFWKDRPASAENLRLFVPDDGWASYSDKLSDDKKVETVGSQRLIESAFLNSLNATNLILLAGAGASFAAQNPETASKEAEKKLQPAGMADLWQAVRARVGGERFQATCDRFPAAPVGDNIERLLTLCKLYLELNETADDENARATKTFVAEAEQAILGRVDFIDSNTHLDAHAAVIQKGWTAPDQKAEKLRFFTTNYDLCFEEAARRHRFTTIDGFSHGRDQVYDPAYFDYDIVRREHGKETPDYIENVFHLYKLHGSIDWRRRGMEIFRSRATLGNPLLIFPRSSKYQESLEAPYLDMIGAFQTALREPDTAVIVSGFGFNDDHVSRPILAAVEANMSLRIVICDPLFVAEELLEVGAHVIAESKATDNRFVKALTRLAQSGDRQIHLINGRFEDMALALPDLVGETDRERHANRIRSLRDQTEGAP